MSAIISESDEHYQRIPIGRITQNSANDYTEVEIEPAEAATNSGTAVINISLKPTYVPNAFGKGRHGASVWDVKQWIHKWLAPIIMEAGQTNGLSWNITDDGATRTVQPRLSDEGVLEAYETEAKTITGAAGEIFTLMETTTKHPQPMEILDGNSFNLLLTASKYRMGMDSVGLGSTRESQLAMDARRVIVPLNEVFFDREDIAGLLDAVVLESILGN